ncbi:MAG: hypothetical protein HYZ27_04530 [Deltaproteobacteria bacterium]|nr:hypothetical protein [Deltaproteobacteria bacterium]
MKRALWVLVALLLSCAHRPGAGGTEVEIITEDALVAEQSLQHVAIDLPYEIKNPTRDTVSIAGIDWKLVIEGGETLSGQETPSVSAGPRASARGALKVVVKLATTDEAFAARKEMPAQIFRASATVSTRGGGNEAFEAEWYGEFLPPRRPTVSVVPLAGRYGDVLELNFSLVIENLNGFALRAEGLDYAVFIDGVEVMRGRLAEGRELGPGTETQFDLARQLGKEDHKPLARKLIARAVVPYRIEAVLNAGGIQIKDTLAAEVQFPR